MEKEINTPQTEEKTEDKDIQIKQSELQNLVEEATNKKVDKLRDEISEKMGVFGSDKNVIPKMSKDEEKPAILGSLASTIYKANKTRSSFAAAAEKLRDTRKTNASDIIYQKTVNESAIDEGGALIDPEFSSEIIELLRNEAKIRNISGVRNLNMNTNQWRIKRNTSGVTTYWDGEQPSELSKSTPNFGYFDATPRKLVAAVGITNDMLDDESSGVEQLIQDDIVKAMNNKEEVSFLRGDSGTYEPKGIYHWVNEGDVSASHIFSATETSNAKIEEDLNSMLTLLQQANQKGPYAYLMSYRSYGSYRTLRTTNGAKYFPELSEANPSIFGIPVIVTNNIPITLGGGSNTEVYLLAASDFIIIDRLDFQLSINPPHNDSSIAQGIDETLFFAKKRVDCLLRHDSGAVILEDVTK